MASCTTSSASWSLRVSQRARLNAASRCGITSCSNLARRSLKARSWYRARSGDDAQRAAHQLVVVAAEHVAEERKSAGLLRRQAQARHLPRQDVGAHAQIDRLEAHVDVVGGQL